ncbi:ATP-binding protein [Pseudaquidulcibacter saccharophilus]|uniref:ATP-binding protein n=1 Tax=Pseudaquidulcibacter saccharophilus TaxID=2831900 RepID=UPI001EFF551A|nr:HAMP domain-containing sensor histidine kinase [Pseudaquidulcibacter saccharophilus]
MSSSYPQQLEAITSRKNFRLLVMLRLLAIIIYGAVFMVAYNVLSIFIPIRTLMIELQLMILMQFLAVMRLKSKNPINDAETFVWLLLDTIFLIVVMLQTGGPSNPFLLALIIPIILGSLLLSKRYAWSIYVVGIIGFLFIEFVESPFVVGKSRHTAFFEVQAQGMMLSFALSSLILVYFVTKAMQNLKERDKAIFELQQNATEQQNILRLGLMSAGAAHELGGPLATMSIILNDWLVLNPPSKKAERDEEVKTLLSQLERAKNILTRILASSGQIRGQGARHDDFGNFLVGICKDWESHNGQNVQLLHEINFENINAACDLILEQAIVTILNNAKDASIENKAKQIALQAYLDDESVIIKIEDFGKGAPVNLMEKIRKENYSTKNENGFGVGLFLAQGTMKALGGGLHLDNKPNNGGVIVTMHFPLKAIMI